MAATIPQSMAAPTLIPTETGARVTIDAATQATTVVIGWVALTAAQAGASPVTGYRIRRNRGYGTSLMLETPADPLSFPDLQSTPVTLAVKTAEDLDVLSYEFTELLIGVTYKIVIAAVNAVHTDN